MKKVLIKFIALSSIGLLMLSACKKDGALVTSNGGKAGTLTASVTTLPLNKALVSDTTTVINFTFTAPSYNFAAAVTNTLQIDASGDNWKNPASFTMGTKVYAQGFSTPVFNSLLLKLNLPAGTASTVSVRIQHALSSTVSIYSNVLSLTVTPFNLQSWVYVPGAYEGWTFPSTTADSLLSATDNGIYTGIINFPAGGSQFLIVPAQSWTNKWATNETVPTAGAASYPVTYNGNNNFTAPTTGGEFLVTLNTNTNILTIVPADYYSVIGSTSPGTAWTTDTPLKYINDGNGNWSISGVAMTVGLAPNNGFKIRQDDAWSWSWGTSSTTGVLTDNSGGNISIATAGNYNVTFNMPATTFGTTPAVTAAYTLVQQP